MLVPSVIDGGIRGSSPIWSVPVGDALGTCLALARLSMRRYRSSGLMFVPFCCFNYIFGGSGPLTYAWRWRHHDWAAGCRSARNLAEMSSCGFTHVVRFPARLEFTGLYAARILRSNAGVDWPSQAQPSSSSPLASCCGYWEALAPLSSRRVNPSRSRGRGCGGARLRSFYSRPVVPLSASGRLPLVSARDSEPAWQR